MARLAGAGIALAVLTLYPAADAAVIGHWTFDEGTGTTTTDLSGNSLDGTLSSPTLWTTDHPAATGYGHSLSFDRDLGQTVTVGHNALLNANATSIQFWYNDSDEAGRSLYEPGDISYGYVGGMQDAWFIERYRPDAVSPITIKLFLKHSGATGEPFQDTYSIFQYIELPQDGAWHNIAFTCTANGLFSSYLDGVPQNSYNNNIALAPNSASDMTLGTAFMASYRHYSFELGEFYFYNNAITAQEVLDNMASIPEPASLALLLAGGLLACRRKRG